jgi:hypothetical protein
MEHLCLWIAAGLYTVQAAVYFGRGQDGLAMAFAAYAVANAGFIRAAGQ